MERFTLGPGERGVTVYDCCFEKFLSRPQDG